MILDYLKNPVYLSIVIYILGIVAILYLKPKIFFDKQGNLKCTGCGNNKSIKVIKIQRQGKNIQNIREFILASSIKKDCNLNNA